MHIYARTHTYTISQSCLGNYWRHPGLGLQEIHCSVDLGGKNLIKERSLLSSSPRVGVSSPGGKENELMLQ